MELKTILQRIDNLRVELDELRPLDATQEAQVLQKFRLDWNYHSSKIEGNTLTYGETKALLLFGITAQGKPLRHHFEITGHNEAIKWVMDVVANKEPFTENLIRQLHTILLKERYQVDAVTADGKPTRRWIEVGQYKSTPNHVRTITDEIFYFATPEETPSKMHDLINWFRAEVEKDEVNPLILAAEFHYRFIRIHPFDDGNGRVARLLMNFILLMKGLPPVIIKTEDKQNYFAALRQADAGVLNSFTEYIGTNLIHSLELMIKAAKGENIEELDDIDKEIALFKKELKIENPNSKKVMLDKLQNSILDLKQGFAFAAKKQRVNLLDRHFYIDLVFYNRLLKSFVLIDLKNGHLNPKDLEKMRLAVNYYNDEERLETENKTIGIVIGKLKNDLIVEYVLPKGKTKNLITNQEKVLPNKEKFKAILNTEIK